MTTREPLIECSDASINVFIKRFSTGHWATQSELNRAKGSTTYVPGDKCELTPTLASRHLKKEITLGSYAITTRNTCKFIVLDFDSDTRIARNLIDNPGSSKAKKAFQDALTEIREDITKAIEGLHNKLNIDRDQILVEFSGSKGYHVWMFFSEEIPARDTFIVTRVIASELDIDIEMFPAQDHADEGSPGSLIKLPLSVNRKTGNFCGFVGEDWEYLEDQVKAIETVKCVSSAQVKDILNLQNTRENMVDIESGDDVTSFGGSIDTMISKCAVLSEMRDMVGSIDPDTGIVNFTHDQRIFMLSLFKKFGAVGEERIHKWLEPCDNYDRAKTDDIIRNSNLKPMTCKTACEKGVCHFKDGCKAITDAIGKSPIRLSGAKDRRNGEPRSYFLDNLSKIESPILCNKKIIVEFTVSALSDKPFFSYKKVCFQPCDEACPKFALCQKEDKEVRKVVNISGGDKLHIQIYNEKDEKAIDYVKSKVTGCLAPKYLKFSGEAEKVIVQPFTCSNIVKTMSEQEVEEVHSDEESGRRKEDKSGTINGITAAKEMKDYHMFCLQNTLESSKSYRGTATVLANPQNQKITAIFEEVTPLNDQIDNFKIVDENKDAFEKFKCLTIEEKVKDLVNNVLFIYGRDEVITGLLISMFSPLEINFNGAGKSKGWVDVLLVGDSGQAKSKMVTRLMNFIGLGTIASSNCSTAGLIGGVDCTPNGNYMNWGIIPRADKTAVFIDEIQALDARTLEYLRTIRSEGVADINKIQKGSRPARIRLIAAANPIPCEKTIAEYSHGAEALATVMSPADIRRFGLGFVLSAVDNKVDNINKVNSGGTPVLNSRLWKIGLLWAWSRKEEHCIFTPEVTSAILKLSSELSAKFDAPTVPLCSAADMREKLANMVSSVACLNGRTEDNIHVIPTLEDVEWLKNYINNIYSHPSCNLDGLAEEKRKEMDLSDSEFDDINNIMKCPEYEKLWPVICKIATLNGPFYITDVGASLGISSVDCAKLSQKLSEYQLVAMGKQSRSLEARSKLMKLYKKKRERMKESYDKSTSHFNL